jgi:hypothetical protein
LGGTRQMALVLSKPRPIRPVMCKDWLGLWTPSTAVMRKLPGWVRSLENGSESSQVPARHRFTLENTDAHGIRIEPVDSHT